MHYEAIQVDPEWRDEDIERVHAWLLARLAHRTNDAYETVAQNTTFERRTQPGGEIEVACYTPPVRPAVVVWSVGHWLGLPPGSAQVK
jgi:hypothetical protein